MRGIAALNVVNDDVQWTTLFIERDIEDTRCETNSKRAQISCQGGSPSFNRARGTVVCLCVRLLGRKKVFFLIHSVTLG